MHIAFNKYEGTGNDFILLDNRTNIYDKLSEDQVKYLCKRNFGIGADGLGRVLRDSSIRLVILNGQAVVKGFEILSETRLDMTRVPGWELPRKTEADVSGTCYVGETDRVGGVRLVRPVRIVGFNHNLQSSFGVTALVVERIGRWLEVQHRVLAET